MILNETPIESNHRGLISKGSLGELFVQATLSCCFLIDDVIRTTGQTSSTPSQMVSDLGARIINMAGGGGRAISCGYWSLATHALRDLVETGQLLELFEAMPSKATEWSQTDPMKRHGAFGFSKVKGDLEKHRGKSEFWQERFSIYSNLGSHPSRESLTFNLTPRGKMVGPTFNEGRFKLWLRALAGDTMVTTRQFVRAFDATSGQAPLSVQRRFLHATVEGFHNLTEPITESDLSLYWVP